MKESYINSEKTRLIVLTDISSIQGGVKEPDDAQSLIRLLLYSNEFDIEGLISTYTGHWMGIKPEYIKQIVDVYGEVRDNLILHDPRFPTVEYLKGCIKSGSTKIGINEIGPGKDTEGSDWIISVVDKSDSRPVWITVWGGPLDLAQAIWRVCADRKPEEARLFKSKIRVYSILNQYDNTGKWIKKNHPDIFYITSYTGFRGMNRGGDTSLVSPDWLHENITTDHGPLGAMYPVYSGADTYTKTLGKIHGIKEGDTSSFLYLIPNGLSDIMHPRWGNWGGRFENAEGHPKTQFFDAVDNYNDECSQWVPVSRWRKDFQADFAARMDWCVKPYDEANHAPIAVVDSKSKITVFSGSTNELDASKSFDPDGNNLSYKWYYYSEPSSYKGKFNYDIENRGILIFGAIDQSKLMFKAPDTNEAVTIHIILKVSDDGMPSLTSYKRVIVTVVPNKKA